MFSKIVRRTHMYLALFLTPWVLMYALSTIAMNHRDFFRGRPHFEKEREQVYAGAFAPGAKSGAMAVQILRDLGLDGAHNVNAPPGGGRVVITRLDPLSPRRLTFTPADSKLVIEKGIVPPSALLEHLHRRRGFQYNYVLEKAWATAVDLFIVAMVFWVLSGLWMWWEMQAVRRWGAVFAAAGVGVFAFFLLTI